MISRGLDALRTAGQLDRTIIVAVGDHGEALGDHGESTHGLFAYESELRVPMIVSAPGLRPGIVRTPVATVDLVPTVLRLLGLGVPPGLDGRPLLSDTDDATGNARALYFEALDASLTRGWAPLREIIADPWKYIELPEPELYDLNADAGEQKAEHEREEQRLEHRADHDPHDVALGHDGVAAEERQENARGHASFLPVSEMKSVSRLGRERWMSRTV